MDLIRIIHEWHAVLAFREGSLQLYYSPNLNPRVAVAVAKYLNSPVEFIRADPRDPRNEDAFRPINPNTLAPVLVENGISLWETDAIAARLSAVAGNDFFATGDLLPETLRWISWGTHHFTRACDVYYFENIIRPKYIGGPKNEPALANAAQDLKRFAPILDEILAGRTWLMDNRLTYADFRVATALPFAEEAKMPLEDYKNIANWHDRLNQIDAWRDPFAGLAA
jgi:glutathione S-transferase